MSGVPGDASEQSEAGNWQPNKVTQNPAHTRIYAYGAAFAHTEFARALKSRSVGWLIMCPWKLKVPNVVFWASFGPSATLDSANSSQLIPT
jgi:hypothetical protein